MASLSSHLASSDIRRVYITNWEIKKYNFGIASNGMIFIPNFMKIRSPVLELFARACVVRRTTAFTEDSTHD